MNRFDSETDPTNTQIEEKFETTFRDTGVDDIFAAPYFPSQETRSQNKEYQQILVKEGGDEEKADRVFEVRSRFVAALPVIQAQLGQEYTMEDMIEKIQVLTEYTYWQMLRIENPPDSE
jgi:hypothetical protein